MTSKIIKIKDIGNVEFVKSKRAKRFNISIKPFKPVKISFPYSSSYKSAKEVILKKTNWIKKTLDKIQKKENKLTIFDKDTKFNTKFHKFIIIKGEYFNINTTENIIKITLPNTIDITTNNIQKAIRRIIEDILKYEASEFIPKRVKYFADKLNINYNKITIRNSKTRWGSCSAKNNINFSLHLMRLPDTLIDYVILHELAHIIERNHSKKYWELLEKICVNSKQLNKELKNYSPSIY